MLYYLKMLYKNRTKLMICHCISVVYESSLRHVAMAAVRRIHGRFYLNVVLLFLKQDNFSILLVISFDNLAKTNVCLLKCYCLLLCEMINLKRSNASYMLAVCISIGSIMKVR